MKNFFLSLVLALPASAGDLWRLPASQWTEQSAQQVLQASPWAKPIGRLKMTVRWESAAPVRLAVEKLKAEPSYSDCESCYVIAVVGLGSTRAAGETATLRSTGRTAIAAFKTRAREDMILFFFHSVGLYTPTVFRFPFGHTLGDQIEFTARIGTETIKRKFSPLEMTYDGKLQLL